MVGPDSRSDATAGELEKTPPTSARDMGKLRRVVEPAFIVPHHLEHRTELHAGFVSLACSHIWQRLQKSENDCPALGRPGAPVSRFTALILSVPTTRRGDECGSRAVESPVVPRQRPTLVAELHPGLTPPSPERPRHRQQQPVRQHPSRLQRAGETLSRVRKTVPRRSSPPPASTCIGCLTQDSD